MNYSIDLNCDLGEGSTLADCDKDALLMPFLSSCNIACGGHAGNDEVMLASIKNAKSHKLNIGAHPGYPDKKNFGRISLDLSIEALLDSLVYQIELFLTHCQALETLCSHIKFHGALYNDLECEPELRSAVVELLKTKYSSMNIFGLAGGNFERVCKLYGLSFIPEGFIDRSYQQNGTLTPRSQPGALITNPQLSAQQAELIASSRPIKTLDGTLIQINAQTLCIHGDGENALESLRAVFENLVKANIKVVAPK